MKKATKLILLPSLFLSNLMLLSPVVAMSATGTVSEKEKTAMSAGADTSLSSSKNDDIERSCRKKAMEMAVATYNSCFSEEKNAQIEKIKKEYQDKLKALKSFYEAEIKKINERHANDDKNDGKDEKKTMTPSAVPSVASTTTSTTTTSTTTTTLAAPAVVTPVVPVEKKASKAPLENTTINDDVNKIDKSETVDKVEKLEPIEKKEVEQPVVDDKSAADKSLSEKPVTEKPAQEKESSTLKKIKKALNKKSKNTQNGKNQRTIVKPSVGQKTEEKVITQDGDEKIVLKKDPKAKMVSQKNKKTSTAKSEAKSNPVIDVKKDLESNKETVAVSVPPTASDLKGESGDSGMTIQLKPAPKIKAVTEESSSDVMDIPEPVQAESTNSNAW